MKLDDESETKGLSSVVCLIIALAVIVGWTYGVHSGIVGEVLLWLKEGM